MCVCVCVCVAKPVAVELRCHATALIQSCWDSATASLLKDEGKMCKDLFLFKILV